MDPNQQAANDRKYHDWETYGAWGVMYGMSRCKKCGILATEESMTSSCKESKNERS